MGSIQKLKKQILQEEMRRRRKRSNKRLLIPLVLLLVAAIVAGGFWYRSNQASFTDRQFIKAEALLADEKFAEAAKAFHALARSHPDHERADEALFLVGELQHLYLKNDREALLAYLLLDKNYPDSPLAQRAQRRAGDIYMDRMEDLARAVVIYQKLIDQGVAEADQLQYRIAEAYFRLNNFEQARIEWEHLLKLHPESSLAPEAGYRIAVSQALQQDFSEAQLSFEKVFTTWPDHPYALEARFGLATLLEEQEYLKDALDILTQLRDSYPKPEVLELRIEQVRDRMEKKQQAI
jgi:TolA-binding protein